jgi:hypothetical protein
VGRRRRVLMIKDLPIHPEIAQQWQLWHASCPC